MKRLASIITALLLIVGSWGFAGATQAQASDLNIFTLQSSPVLAVRRNTADDKRLELETGKLDLNNSDVREFRKLRGFYPTLASKIIQNATGKLSGNGLVILFWAHRHFLHTDCL